MADKPMIFSAPMVRALLDGRKTQTRRVLSNVPEAPAMDDIKWPDNNLHPAPYVDAYCGAKRTADNPRGMTANWAYWTRDDRPGPLFRVGYAPGDRLWVREAHALVPASAYRCSEGVEQALSPRDEMAAIYREGFDRCASGIRWRPSIHMPRWASRLTLIVTDVRVQRLQEINAEDATSEGIPWEPEALAPYEWSITRFANLWNSIHGPDAWDANPWVCALTFTVHHRNIDQVEAASV